MLPINVYLGLEAAAKCRLAGHVERAATDGSILNEEGKDIF